MTPKNDNEVLDSPTSQYLTRINTVETYTCTRHTSQTKHDPQIAKIKHLLPQIAPIGLSPVPLKILLVETVARITLSLVVLLSSSAFTEHLENKLMHWEST